MKSSSTSIREYMTANPQVIGVDESLETARQRMNAFNIRHLPVVDGHRLVGVVTARDLRILESFRQVDTRVTPVREAMTPAPFAVTAGSMLEEVARTMAVHKLGSAIVTTVEGKVVGIFTATDALRALVDALNLSDARGPTSTRWGHVIE